MTPNSTQNTIPFLDDVPLAELHAHMGAALTATELWEMAHNQGLRLPTKEYRKFEQMIDMSKPKSFEEQLKVLDLTERIQSSPDAMFSAIQYVISEAFRKNNITTLELRFNPIWRTRDGETDMDHIMVYTIQGMERALLKYPVKAGIILCLDRRLTPERNAHIVKKAIKYKDRGVVGIDLAGPVERTEQAHNFSPKDIGYLADEAHTAGLGVTFHTGEVTGADEMWEVLKYIRPDRIGHGIACVTDEKLMAALAEKNIVLETCPRSNIATKVAKDYEELKKIYATLEKHSVPFTINTDWPASLHISLRGIFTELYTYKVLSEEALLRANKLAHQSTFITHAD